MVQVGTRHPAGLNNMKKLAAFVLAIFVCAIAVVAAQQKKAATPEQEWRTYNHDLAGTRFSPLTDVNAGNVANLKQAWVYTFPAPPGGGRGGGLGGASEAVPIVVGGVMYVPAGNNVVALEADTGKVIWQREVAGVSRRGVGFWPGDRNTPERIIVAAGRKLLSFDAATGKPSEGFGTNGEVDMVIGYGGTPTIVKNVIMVGAAVNEVPQGPPGDTRAFDAVTGKKLWEFHTVPRPGEVGHETWLDDGWKDRSGTNTWGFSADRRRSARASRILPIAGPAANYYGGDRPGNNLFGNSIVAVDATRASTSGISRPCITTSGTSTCPRRPGWSTSSKTAGRFPRSRLSARAATCSSSIATNGKPVFGVEERPVPKGDVPGEWYSPTQPFPVKPPALAQTSFKKEDMVTAEDTTASTSRTARRCGTRAADSSTTDRSRRSSTTRTARRRSRRFQFPGGTGGINWGGTATDPRTGYIYVQLARHVARRLGGEEEAGRKLRLRHRRFELACTIARSVDGAGPFHTFSAPSGPRTTTAATS